ncbi:MAG: hypothetical protein HFJ25_01375 [Clostridia bacterium]|nr:hypothetical protein [Clostridia bacterium]
MKVIEEYLKEITGDEIEIGLSGFINGNLKIKNLKYYIEYDILKLEDEKSSNNININLNQIIKVNLDNNRKHIIIYLDNDLNISMQIVKESI